MTEYWEDAHWGATVVTKLEDNVIPLMGCKQIHKIIIIKYYQP